MKRVDRYIAGAVLRSSLAVLGVMAALAMFFTFIGELDNLSGNYDAARAALFVLLSLPNYLYEFFPALVLVGTLVGLGGLAANSELTVLRAAGLSRLRLFGAVLLGGSLLVGLAVVVGEYVGPAGYQQAKSMRAAAEGRELAHHDRAGLWVRDGRRFVRVGWVMADRRLRDISVFVFDESRELETIVHAREARLTDAGWRLTEVSRHAVGEDSVASRRVAEETWERLIRPELFEILVVDPVDMPARTLLDYIGYLEANGLDSERYRLAFWIKVLTPVSTLVMLVLALPFVFGSQRKAGAGQRIFAGIVLGLAFWLAGRVLNHLGPVYHVPPFLSAALPLVLFLVIGLLVLRRIP